MATSHGPSGDSGRLDEVDLVLKAVAIIVTEGIFDLDDRQHCRRMVPIVSGDEIADGAIDTGVGGENANRRCVYRSRVEIAVRVTREGDRAEARTWIDDVYGLFGVLFAARVVTVQHEGRRLGR
ncbi:MAG: hypothetical protein ACI9C1_000281, partial [Candidatus Aldehydirespiratoraceae bacterium]